MPGLQDWQRGMWAVVDRTPCSAPMFLRCIRGSFGRTPAPAVQSRADARWGRGGCPSTTVPEGPPSAARLKPVHRSGAAPPPRFYPSWPFPPRAREISRGLPHGDPPIDPRVPRSTKLSNTWRGPSGEPAGERLHRHPGSRSSCSSHTPSHRVQQRPRPERSKSGLSGIRVVYWGARRISSAHLRR